MNWKMRQLIVRDALSKVSHGHLNTKWLSASAGYDLWSKLQRTDQRLITVAATVGSGIWLALQQNTGNRGEP